MLLEGVTQILLNFFSSDTGFNKPDGRPLPEGYPAGGQYFLAFGAFRCYLLLETFDTVDVLTIFIHL